MQKNTTDKEIDVLIALYEKLMQDSHTICEIDEKNQLMIRLFFSVNVFISTLIFCSNYGYIIRMNFHIGQQDCKYALTKIANALNEKLREGSFYVDTDSYNLFWKEFIPYAEGIGPNEILRSYKAGIGSFLTRADKFIEAIDDNFSEEGITIIETDDIIEKEDDSDEC